MVRASKLLLKGEPLRKNLGVRQAVFHAWKEQPG
jgi:hypothetical protein